MNYKYLATQVFDNSKSFASETSKSTTSLNALAITNIGTEFYKHMAAYAHLELKKAISNSNIYEIEESKLIEAFAKKIEIPTVKFVKILEELEKTEDKSWNDLPDDVPVKKYTRMTEAIIDEAFLDIDDSYSAKNDSPISTKYEETAAPKISKKPSIGDSYDQSDAHGFKFGKFYLFLLSHFGHTKNLRVSRGDFWRYTIYYCAILLLIGEIGVIFNSLTHSQGQIPLFIAIPFIITLCIFIPANIILGIGRLHDVDMSGILLAVLPLIPFLGSIMLFIFLLSRGDTEENNYGNGGTAAKNRYYSKQKRKK